MTVLERILLASRTHNTGHAGTNSRIGLIINQDGRDVVHKVFSDLSNHDRGQGTLDALRPDDNVDTDQFNVSSVRVAIHGENLWRPEHLFLWGEALETRAVTPVALEMDVNLTLSTDPDDDGGAVGSIPLRPVSAGNDQTIVQRLLVIVSTAADQNAQTDSPLRIQFNIGGQSVVDFTFEDTPQDDFERFTQNVYLVPVRVPFTRGEFQGGAATLRIIGRDRWKPVGFMVFGLNTSSDRPNAVVPLTYDFPWSHGFMSTDVLEGGVPEVTLTPATV